MDLQMIVTLRALGRLALENPNFADEWRADLERRREQETAEPEEPTCDECRRPIGDGNGCCRCGEREERARQAAYRRGLGI